MKELDEVDKVKMRVGALPKYKQPNGILLTWSTSGLINEYVNDCDIISNYEHKKAQPLDGYEPMVDGDRYEDSTRQVVQVVCVKLSLVK